VGVELRFTGWFVAAFLLGIVAIIVSPHTALNPGFMSKGHEFLKNDCSKCHEIPGGPVSKKCVACHDPQKTGLVSATSNPDFKANELINRLHKNIDGLDCLRCHLEHTGRSKELADSLFSHSMISAGGKVACTVCHDFQMPQDGVHTITPNQCSTCHETETWKKTYFNHNVLGDQKTRCSFCHAKVKPDDQMHSSFETENSCEICHTTKEWKPSTFTHDEHFVFDKNHPNSCLNCHKADDNHKTWTCYNCHAHQEEAIAKSHKNVGVLYYKNCVKCHRSGDNYFSDKNKQRKREKEQWREEMKWAE